MLAAERGVFLSRSSCLESSFCVWGWVWETDGKWAFTGQICTSGFPTAGFAASPGKWYPGEDWRCYPADREANSSRLTYLWETTGINMPVLGIALAVQHPCYPSPFKSFRSFITGTRQWRSGLCPEEDSGLLHSSFCGRSRQNQGRKGNHPKDVWHSGICFYLFPLKSKAKQSKTS